MSFTPNEEGIWLDLDEDIYRKAPGANQSLLKIILEYSPAHMKAELDNPHEPTRPMKLGTTMHSAILKPSSLGSLYAVEPIGYDGRTQAGKAWKEKHGHRMCLSQEEHQAVIAMIDKINDDPGTSDLISGCDTEVSWFARMPGQDGVFSKGRWDGVNDSQKKIIDLKFTHKGGACPRLFSRMVKSNMYHVQAALYSDAYERLMGKRYEFYFIVVENEYPYEFKQVKLEERWITLGRELYLSALDKWKRCSDSGNWVGYAREVETLVMPRWAMPGYSTIEDIDPTIKLITQ